MALVFIAGATLTPTGRVGPPSVLWCTTCGASWLTDIFTNVALFLPLGACVAALNESTARTTLLGAALSLTIEGAQFAGIPAGRTAALNDFLANGAGACLGALLWHSRVSLVDPVRSHARVLTGAWSVLLLTTLLGTSWALAPATFVADDIPVISPSDLPFTPGYGWYSAEVESVLVNGVRVAHRGSGPVIVRLARFGATSDTLRGSFAVQGRDDRRGVVPMLYAHSPTSRAPVMLVGQRGDGVVLRSARQGREIGLVLPDATVPHVFNGDISTTRRVKAVEARGALGLRTESSAVSSDSTSLVLTPALGWTMLQSVVGPESPFAAALSVLWIALWFAIGGRWAAHALGRIGAFVWSVGVLAALYGGTAILAMPFLTPAHALVALVACGVASLGATTRPASLAQ